MEKTAKELTKKVAMVEVSALGAHFFVDIMGTYKVLYRYQKGVITMPRPYVSPNGRVVIRDAFGRFRRSTLEDFGIAKSELQSGPAVCANCGYGSGEEKWYPILRTGQCPQCGSEEKEGMMKCGDTDDA